ncbi:hypothetical protein GCM10022243_19970 [Saccharothrix violaceirubra]|uniref:Pyrroloquinoline quinone (PQQ) biosynthesis protein C n=1 Tax=Saccharothrix violaceirubra TaxID=413306 RepID=A0A7W7T232_9PSEU|nr:iron-containing redox enzyme family protein [Saccharothrix violaceirubra]MBB4965098.1 pyrroloquinoline quinone (PQQ) biosynthesis protein C [Saccharothrix violaceirubra]
MTTRYETATAEVAAELALVEEHPFVRTILDGKLTKPVYAAYLRESYHLVHETPFFLSAAASYSRDEGWLQDWFLDLAIDERHHDRLCVHDLRNLGLEPADFLGSRPGLGTWTMVSQNHYLATKKDPAGIIGFAAATEGLGAELAPKAAKALVQYPFTHDALSFLKVHSTEDVEHIEEVKKAFERVAESDERYELMVEIWKFTLRAYAQLFTDSVERGEHDAQLAALLGEPATTAAGE